MVDFIADTLSKPWVDDDKINNDQFQYHLGTGYMVSFSLYCLYIVGFNV